MCVSFFLLSIPILLLFITSTLCVLASFGAFFLIKTKGFRQLLYLHLFFAIRRTFCFDSCLMFYKEIVIQDLLDSFFSIFMRTHGTNLGFGIFCVTINSFLLLFFLLQVRES